MERCCFITYCKSAKVKIQNSLLRRNLGQYASLAGQQASLLVAGRRMSQSCSSCMEPINNRDTRDIGSICTDPLYSAMKCALHSG